MSARCILFALLALVLAACGSTAPTVPAGSTPPGATTNSTGAPARTPSPAPSPTASTQCSNPYYPVSASAQWQYRSTTGGLAPATYTQTVTAITSNSFTEHREFAALKTDNVWNCAADGSLSSTQVGNLSANTGQFQLQTTKNTGMTIPAAKDWKVGASWSNSYEVKGTILMRGVSANATGSVELSFSVVAQESVTVPAGTYDAMKVASTSTMKLRVNANGVELPVDVVATSTQWYAQNVGMVKTQTSTQGIDSAVELLSFTP